MPVFCLPSQLGTDSERSCPQYAIDTMSQLVLLNPASQHVNAKLPGGKYRLSALPDNAAPNAPKEFAFHTGNLTNRLSAFDKGDLTTAKDLLKSGKLHLSMFADHWKRRDPFTVYWDFGANVKISEIRIFYKGELPPLNVSANNKILLQTQRETSAAQEVKMAVFPFSSGTIWALEICFAQRSANEELILSEIEFWGTVSK